MFSIPFGYIYTMQKPSYLGNIVLVSICIRMVLTQIILMQRSSHLDILIQYQHLTGNTIWMPTGRFFETVIYFNYRYQCMQHGHKPPSLCCAGEIGGACQDLGITLPNLILPRPSTSSTPQAQISSAPNAGMTKPGIIVTGLEAPVPSPGTSEGPGSPTSPGRISLCNHQKKFHKKIYFPFLSKELQ